MKYYDKNGKEIKAETYLRFSDGSIEKIYDCTDAYGEGDLGINASNEAYMQTQGLGECDREFYSLSNFNLQETELCEPEEVQSDATTMQM